MVIKKYFKIAVVVWFFVMMFSNASFAKWFPPKASKCTVVVKNSSANPYPNKSLKEMTEVELLKMLAYAKPLNDREFVFKIFHYLLSLSSDQNNLKTYKLDLADYCFSIKEFEKAALTYEEFTILYPGANEIEYAQYKCIVSWFTLCLEPTKDQTLTDKIIFLIDEYLKKASNQKLIEEIKDIRKQCRKKLFHHEVHVFEHYLKRKKIKSAQARKGYIEQHFDDIDHIKNYVDYCSNMLEMVKDPKTCPFLIQFDLRDALSKTIQTPDKKAKTALFFLS
ncbi:outer membrane protein assembly factor BamD [Candidatus Dependentiae bacterium]|nr:outer membrane protein assembly factor BamD [Candidatus Dependentiae bacterium]